MYFQQQQKMLQEMYFLIMMKSHISCINYINNMKSKILKAMYLKKIYHTMDSVLLHLKGSFAIFLFSVRSHILNSNGVWYW